MGRVKLKIKKLESSGNRQVTYSKRRNGILKKAKELSILCDVDITLLMFSPTNKATLFQGERSSLEDTLAKFAQATPQERAKRKLDSLEVLKKTFKKLDHDINVQEFVGSSTPTVEHQTNRARELQSQLRELHRRLSFYSNPEKVEDVEQLRQMENILNETLRRTRQHKENFQKQQLASLNCTNQSMNCTNQSMNCTNQSMHCANQFQNGMPPSLILASMQETQPIPWMVNNDNQHLIIPNETAFLPHRDMDCSTNASVAQFNNYFDGSASTSTSTCKQSEVGDPGQLVNMGKIPSMGGGCGLNEYDINACLSEQLGEQYAYPSYCNPNMPDDKKLVKSGLKMNLPTNPVDYQASNNFELSKSLYGEEHPPWLSSSGPSSFDVYNDNTYQQQPNMRL